MFMDGNFNFSFEPLVSLFFQRREKKLPSASTPLIYIYIYSYIRISILQSLLIISISIRVSSNFEYFPDTQRNATTLLTLELTGEGEGKIARSGERSADLSA